LKSYRIVSLSKIFQTSPGGWKVYTLAYECERGVQCTLYGDVLLNIQNIKEPILAATLRNELQDIIRSIKALAKNPNLEIPTLRNETLKKYDGQIVVYAFPSAKHSGQVRLYCLPVEDSKSLILFGGGRKYTTIAQDSPQTKPAIEVANKAAFKILRYLETRSFDDLLNETLRI
jgi:hypothetical protein